MNLVKFNKIIHENFENNEDLKYEIESNLIPEEIFIKSFDQKSFDLDRFGIR